jgi:hypothetical protein
VGGDSFPQNRKKTLSALFWPISGNLFVPKEKSRLDLKKRGMIYFALKNRFLSEATWTPSVIIRFF